MQRLREADLRFCDPVEEADFRMFLAPKIAKSLGVAMVALATALLISIFMSYPMEADRTDWPFIWAPEDPRTLYFGVMFYNLGKSVVVAITLALWLRTGMFKALNVELLGVCVGVSLILTLFCMSAWHVAKMYNRAPRGLWLHETLDCEFNKILEMIVIISGAYLYIPVRSCFLWLIPTLTICNYLAVIIFLGSPFPENVPRLVAELAFMCFFAARGAYIHERSLRQNFLAEVQVRSHKLELESTSALVRALHGVAGTNCDVVLQLAGDLKVCRVEQRHSAYFGQSLEGLRITDILIERDREQLVKLTENARSSGIMQSMPATLSLTMGRFPAQVIVVTTGCVHPQFLMGVRVEDTGQDSPVGSAGVGGGSMSSDPCEDLGSDDMTAGSSDAELDSTPPPPWQGDPVSVHFNALSSELTIVQASDGWWTFSGTSSSAPKPTGLEQQLDRRLFRDFRYFVHELVRKALGGDWDPQYASHPYKSVDGLGPDGQVYRQVMVVTLVDPTEAVEGAFGFYPAVLTLEPVPPRVQRAHRRPSLTGGSRRTGGRRLSRVEERHSRHEESNNVAYIEQYVEQSV